MTRPLGARNARKLWIALGVLAVLTPLGLYLPYVFKGGSAWGEWGIDEVERMLGYAPQGMKRLANLWKAPLPDYALPGQENAPLTRLALSYILSAVAGIAACGGGAWIIARWLAGKKK